MMSDLIITFDMETKDPHLKELGAGWATGLGQVLCTCFKINGVQKIFHRKEALIKAIQSGIANSQHVTLIGHNVMYDVGWIWEDLKPYIYDHITLIDTMLLVKLDNNTEQSYSLDYLAYKYLKNKKIQDELAIWCIDNPEICKKKFKTLSLAKKFAMQNLDLLPEDLVVKYCEQDVVLTERLFSHYQNAAPVGWITRLSNCMKALVSARMRGVPIDLKRLQEVSEYLKRISDETYKEICEDIGEEINFNSNKQMRQLADQLSLNYKLSDKGNAVLDAAWLSSQSHPICKKILKYKKYEFSYNNFCLKMIHAQELLPPDKRGKIYGQFNIFGATATGRMSASNPNLQQVPSRDEEIGPLIRSMYVAPDGADWLSCDFSSQEIILAVHYAKLIDATGVDDIIKQYVEDQEFDFHTYGASICGIERKESKAVTLGKMYGMGREKMSKSLGVSLSQADLVLDKYNSAMPYLSDLSDYCMKSIKRKKYIKTILGRKLRLDRPRPSKEKVRELERDLGRPLNYAERAQCMMSFEYKAMNKLIQGSAADQIYEVISQCWEQQIPILFAVHDEINFPLPHSYKLDGTQITIRRYLMENSIDLALPMRTSCGVGKNWSEAK